jgi:hypothetical protein
MSLSRYSNCPHYQSRYPEDLYKGKEFIPSYRMPSDCINIKTVQLDNSKIKPKCVHQYISVCKTNPQPPGFADFLRGSIALYQICKYFGFELKFDVESHPIFTYLDLPSNIKVSIDSSKPTFEVLPPKPYHEMSQILTNHIHTESTPYILTNAFYMEKSDMTDEYTFMKSLLRPNSIIQNTITAIKLSCRIQSNLPYCIIHIRLGDNYLLKNADIDSSIIIKIRNYIEQIKQHTSSQLVCIADSTKIKEYISDLCITTNTVPIHTGSLDTGSIDERIVTTLSEFFLMSSATEIYCINYWDGSGYSKICSKIYSIPYICLQL